MTRLKGHVRGRDLVAAFPLASLRPIISARVAQYLCLRGTQGVRANEATMMLC